MSHTPLIAPELFLMSPPGESWQLRGRANFRSGDAMQVDPVAAFEEWFCLATAIESAGGRVLALPPSGEMTGLPYCAEAGHALGAQGEDERPRFLLPRMWAQHRIGEASLWKPVVERLGFRTVEGDRGFWEGQGDVTSFRGTEILFYGGRTDDEGLASYRSHFGQDALTIQIRQPAFHGNVAMLCIESIERIVVCPALLVGDSLGQLKERFGASALLEISEEEATSYSTNALPVGTSLLAPSIAPERVMRELEALGMTIVSLKMRELCEKAGGASRCLVCRIPPSVAGLLDPDALAMECTELSELAKGRRGKA